MASEFDDYLRKLNSLLPTIRDQVIPILGQQMVDEVRKRTREGYGVSANNTQKQRLAPLSPLYRRRRARIALSPNTSPTRSNLTLTGSMLDSLHFERVGSYQIRVVPSSDNLAKAQFVSVERPFLFLSSPEIKRLENTLRLQVETIARRLL